VTSCRVPAILALATALPGCADPRADMLTFEHYSEMRHPVPYVLEFQSNGGSLLYLGARHSFAVDEQAALIERLWNEHRPDAAFNEGGNPPVAPSRDEAVQRYGEAGLVRWLAARDGVPVATFEPTPRDEAAHLTSEFTVEQVRVFYALRQLAQEARHDADDRRDADDVVRGVFGWLDQQGAAPGEPRTPDAFQSAAARLLPALDDWRHPPMSLFDPVPWNPADTQWTNLVSRRASEFRDDHIVEVLTRAARDGKRVFAVIGASHVVMQEPVLRSRFRAVRTPLATEGAAP